MTLRCDSDGTEKFHHRNHIQVEDFLWFIKRANAP